jgi:hypothetical protein
MIVLTGGRAMSILGMFGCMFGDRRRYVRSECDYLNEVIKQGNQVNKAVEADERTEI